MNIHLKIVVFSLFLISFSGCSHSSEESFINLSGDWKFSPKDDLQFKNNDFDDSKWFEVEVPKSLDKQGYKDFRGIGWYRKAVVMPNDFKKDEMLGIYFSNIADSDEVYFNETLIGESGSFEKNGILTPQFSRSYSISPGIVNTGKNQIAVRFSKKIGPFVGIFNRAPLMSYLNTLKNKASFENLYKSDYLFYSSLLILFWGLYHLYIFLKLRDKKSYLLFFLACLFIAISQFCTILIPYFLADNLLLVTRSNILSSFLGLGFLIWFICAYLGKDTGFIKRLMLVAPPY